MTHLVNRPDNLTLQGKLLYHDACEEKKPWDAPLSPAAVAEVGTSFNPAS